MKVDFQLNKEDFRAVVLAGLGFSADLISAKTGLTHGQVGYRLRKAQVRRADYRQGLSPIARAILGKTKQLAEQTIRRQLLKS